MSTVSLKGIHKSFGATEVLKDVSIDIADGEFLSLVGPSGCGKSTLLRIIAGLEQQTSGQVLIGETDVSHIRPSERNLAMVFQSYALYPHLSVEENMITPLKLRELNSLERMPLLGSMLPSRWRKMREMHQLIAETADILHLTELLKRKPGQLSGGQRQRVAVGRAMVRKPLAFLMDEPLSNLDAALRVHMRAEFAELHRQLKATFIYVTHDQAEALTMSNRIAVMMDGKILQIATPDQIYRNPVDLRVAQFIGSPKMNILPGNSDSTGRLKTIGGYTFHKHLASPNQSVSVGMRPEHLGIAAKAPNGRCLQVTVRHKENLGSDFFIHATIGGTDQKLVVRTVPETANGLSLHEPAEVWSLRDEAVVFGVDKQRIAFANSQPALEEA
jgi:multiple sugar transport system ATP-binding protein